MGDYNYFTATSDLRRAYEACCNENGTCPCSATAFNKYLVFFNSHDGSSGVKVAMTPVRVVCQNTLNLALGTAKRIWTARHTENILLRVQDARETLQLANSYVGELGKGIHELTTIKLSDRKVQEFINEFFPVTEDLTDGQRKNNLRLQEDLKARYYNAPDLEWVGKNGWRFVNAVSDFATHADPIRKTRNYNENLFLRTAEGNPMLDKAFGGTLDDMECMKLTGLARNTYYKYKRQIREDAEMKD